MCPFFYLSKYLPEVSRPAERNNAEPRGLSSITLATSNSPATPPVRTF